MGRVKPVLVSSVYATAERCKAEPFNSTHKLNSLFKQINTNNPTSSLLMNTSPVYNNFFLPSRLFVSEVWEVKKYHCLQRTRVCWSHLKQLSPWAVWERNMADCSDYTGNSHRAGMLKFKAFRYRAKFDQGCDGQQRISGFVNRLILKNGYSLKSRKVAWWTNTNNWRWQRTS